MDKDNLTVQMKDKLNQEKKKKDGIKEQNTQDIETQLALLAVDSRRRQGFQPLANDQISI